MGNDGLILVCIFGWLMGSGLTAAVASEKGRNGFLWGMGAFFLFSPLLALIALAALPVVPRASGHTDDSAGSANVEMTPSLGNPVDLTPWIIVAIIVAVTVAVWAGTYSPRMWARIWAWLYGEGIW